MKKFLSFLLAFCMIVTSVAIFPITVTAEGANNSITVNNADELKQAIKNVANGGTIVINGEIVSSTTDFVFNSGANKTYTITGGSFDFTALTSGDNSRGFVHVKDNVTFENTKFKFDSEKNDYLFANGYNLTIKESVEFEGAKVIFYAGVLNGNCESINITILSGNYSTINCTTNSARTISGNVNVHVGGNVTVNDILGNSGGCTVKGSVSILVDGNASVGAVYGGGNGGTVNGNTYVTVGGNATAKQIYGGGSSGTINGSTYVTLKDNANPNHTVSTSDHSTTYAVYGGGKNNVITGSTNVTVKDNAKSNYIYGGSAGTTATIGEGSNVNMLGGEAYSIYGGSASSNHGSGANVLMSGGTVHQLFGGNEGSSLTGDVTVKLFGGTVMRRVFGGCYNNYVSILEDWKNSGWKSEYCVIGNIYLFISKDADLRLKSENDNALSAHSRREKVASDEIATVIYTSKEAESNKLSAGSVSSGKNPNFTHSHIYTVSRNTVTQKCTCGVEATATVTPTGSVYTGEAILVNIEYTNNWEFYKFAIDYSDNVNAGTATANLEIDGFTKIPYNFDIAKASQSAPSIKISNGVVSGITEEMEYSVDGKNYVPYVNGTELSGKFFVRYAANDNTYSSNAIRVISGLDLSANTVSGRIGDTVEVMVYAPGYTGNGFTLDLEYDSEYLELKAVTNGDVLGGLSRSGDTLTWSSSAVKNKKGTLVKLSFEIKDGASGDYQIAINGEGVSAYNGCVSVVPFVYGDVASTNEEADGKIDMTDIVALRSALAFEDENLSDGADVNGDGEFNSQDIVLLRQYIANYDFDAGESTITLGGN